MKTFFYFIAIAFVAVSCKQNTNKEVTETAEEINTAESLAYQSFGDKITDKEVMSKEEMMAKYENLKPGDTVAVKFATKVNEVCQSKGCWMKLDMGEQEAMVKFKDYGFFMPKDIDGETVIVEGKAFVEEMSVDDQRHYAEDAGKSKEEVAAISEPKRTLSFISNGVLLEEKL